MKEIYSMPRMGIYTDIFKEFFESLGCKIQLPPLITRKTINLGVRNSPDMMCFPYKVTLGSMIESLEAGVTSIIMYENSYGTCRFRHYHTLQRQTLEELGYKFDMGVITSANIIKSIQKITGKSKFTIIRQALKAYKKIREIEEKHYRYRKNSGKLSIGIIGEIYTVLEPSINYDIINKLKKLDVDVHVSCLLSTFLKHGIRKHLPFLKNEAKQYLKFPIGGHGIQSVNHTIQYAKENFDGVVHLSPLTCMPEVTVEPVLNILSKKYELPIYRFPIDENNFEAGFNTRLETFVELLKRKKLGNNQKKNIIPVENKIISATKKYYLGLDIGSISVKAVILNDKKEIFDSIYIRNIGLIDSIQDIFSKLKAENICAVGITGSGKEFINVLVGGDIVKSEIIAHTVGTQHFYPDVHTIFDIGGEDCKLMTLRDGTIQDFDMNRDCGGGTGTILESIAQRMKIKTEDIGDTALKSKTELILPSKCGIFCQSAVVAKLNKGLAKEDIMMGVCRGIASNFLTMLAKGVTLEPPFVFQGATAKNRALVKCFEKELQHEIIVPENCHLMGAFGMAILAKEYIEENNCKTNFKKTIADYETKSQIADGCSNKCEITYIYQKKKLIGTIGNRCEKCI